MREWREPHHDSLNWRCPFVPISFSIHFGFMRENKNMWLPEFETQTGSLTQKKQLVSFICVHNSGVAGRAEVVITFDFSSMQISFQRQLWMFPIALGFSRCMRKKWQAGGRENKVVSWMFPSLLDIASIYSNIIPNLKSCQWKGFTRDCNKFFTQ